MSSMYRQLDEAAFDAAHLDAEDVAKRLALEQTVDQQLGSTVDARRHRVESAFLPYGPDLH
jgi:hypothetical protein